MAAEVARGGSHGGDIPRRGRRCPPGGSAATPHEETYGLLAECEDNQGVRLAVFEPLGGVAGQAGGRTTHGDLVYVTLEVVDSVRSRAFYESVLGRRFVPGRVADGWPAEAVAPMAGISGGHPTATTVPMYRVDDIGTAVRSVRDAGGTATDPEVQPYGITSTCADDQGTRFSLGQL